jgi:type IX secretion system PorP/SprF family membrane protein
MFLRFKITLIFLIASAGIVLSQQLPFSNQYLVNKHFLSPAYSGITGNFEAFLSYQKNALHFPGGPEYKSIYASGPVYGNMSLGVSVAKSSVTIFNSFSTQVYYAYHLKVNEEQFIHFGLSFEYAENYLGLDNQSLSAQSDPYLSKYGYTVNTGFGLIYSFKTFQLGVSIPRMLGAYFRNSNTGNQSLNYSPDYSTPRLYRLHTSCVLDISRSLSLEPVIVVDKSEIEPLWYNISNTFKFKEMTWLELHYQQGGIMGFGFGFNPSKKILFNYAYEFSGNGVMKYSSGNHEISVGFLLGKNSDKKYQRSAFRSFSKQPYYDWIK